MSNAAASPRQALRIGGESDLAIESGGDFDRRYAVSHEPSSEGVGQRRWRIEDRFERYVLLNGSRQMANAFDQVESGAQPALRVRKERRCWNLGPWGLQLSARVC